MNIEKTILTNLIHNEEYTRRVIPFLNREYFQDNSEKYLFHKINKFVEKYNALPTTETLIVEVEQDEINENLHRDVTKYLTEITYEEKNIDWLLAETEKFCQERALYNAIMSSIKIIDGNDKDNDKGTIPTILSDALAVTFDDHIGHDFLENAEERYDFYQKVEDRIPFDLDLLNEITGGGLPKKTLNVLLAGTGVGKTLAMTHMAASNLNEGRNVLYITMEMAEERIAERIDANLLNIKIEDLQTTSKSGYISKIDKIKTSTNGKLIIKEYPTASASAGHFRYLINELALKKNFSADIIYIDYLNICSSLRMKAGASINSYTYVKAIAEELRGLAVEKNLPIVTATQLNRSGFVNSDPGLEDTSESFGLPATADFMLALITSEELENLNQIQVKQLKNRYNDLTSIRRFNLGIDKSKMRLYNVEQAAQDDIHDVPVFDNTTIGKATKRDFNKLFVGS
jgi:replicative DNA helicase